MRPCSHCGNGIANHEVFCAQCKQSQKLAPPAEPIQQFEPKTGRVTFFNVGVFLIELVLTSAIIGTPLGILFSLIALFFVPNWGAPLIGFGAGFATGAIYWAVKGYFLADAYRGPLK